MQHMESTEGKECVELYSHSPIRLHGVVLVKLSMWRHQKQADCHSVVPESPYT